MRVQSILRRERESCTAIIQPYLSKLCRIIPDTVVFLVLPEMGVSVPKYIAYPYSSLHGPDVFWHPPNRSRLCFLELVVSPITKEIRLMMYVD
ncbi:Hypothetical predicted protein [Podarcis lilfordi]|uniref:Uncharacterized protein n=1 Tax=Podarcis lilfordi TaxID=74358 RepID=A0AA35KZN4_9SAUR|nr:Hypothetical predicted protein [Podarcis lilfordi]